LEFSSVLHTCYYVFLILHGICFFFLLYVSSCVFYVTQREKKIFFEREVYENEVYIHTYTYTYMYLRKKMRAVTEIGKHFFKRCNEVTFCTREE
jgi:hypothetical protein